jgi:hypothetical protein
LPAGATHSVITSTNTCIHPVSITRSLPSAIFFVF